MRYRVSSTYDKNSMKRSHSFATIFAVYHAWHRFQASPFLNQRKENECLIWKVNKVVGARKTS